MVEVYDRWHKSYPKPNEQPCSRHNLVPTADHGKGKRWQARWRDELGRGQKKNFERKAPAEDFAREIETKAASGIRINADAGRITFREYADTRVRARRIGESTRNRYLRELRLHVYPFIGDIELRDLQKRSILEDLINGIPLADYTRQSIYTLVNQIFTQAVDDDEIAKNPMHRVPRPRVRPEKVLVWTPDQIAAVTERLPLAYRVAVDLSVGAGLRIGEALGLAVDDIDWNADTPVINVVRQATEENGRLAFALPKHGSSRTVQITPELRDRLGEWLTRLPAIERTYPWQSNPLNTCHNEPADGELVTHSLIVSSKWRLPARKSRYVVNWRTAADRAGVRQPPNHGGHVLRHTYASVLLANGVPITEVASYLGHGNPAVTWQYYAHHIPQTTEGRTWRGLSATTDYLPPMDLPTPKRTDAGKPSPRKRPATTQTSSSSQPKQKSRRL